MRDRFDICLDFVLPEEIGPFKATAGYISVARAAQIGDTGSETIAGVSRVHNPDWPGWAIVDSRKTEPDFPKNLNLDLPRNAELKRLVGEVYRVKYWQGFRCGEMPAGLDLALFDAAVQHLPKPAAVLFQQAVQAKPDGDIGDLTVKAAGYANVPRALFTYFVRRTEFYMDIILADSRQAKNRSGWFSRVFRLQAYILTTTPIVWGGNP